MVCHNFTMCVCVFIQQWLTATVSHPHLNLSRTFPLLSCVSSLGGVGLAGLTGSARPLDWSAGSLLAGTSVTETHTGQNTHTIGYDFYTIDAFVYLSQRVFTGAEDVVVTLPSTELVQIQPSAWKSAMNDHSRRNSELGSQARSPSYDLADPNKARWWRPQWTLWDDVCLLF